MNRPLIVAFRLCDPVKGTGIARPLANIGEEGSDGEYSLGIVGCWLLDETLPEHHHAYRKGEGVSFTVCTGIQAKVVSEVLCVCVEEYVVCGVRCQFTSSLFSFRC